MWVLCIGGTQIKIGLCCGIQHLHIKARLGHPFLGLACLIRPDCVLKVASQKHHTSTTQNPTKITISCCARIIRLWHGVSWFSLPKEAAKTEIKPVEPDLTRTSGGIVTVTNTSSFDGQTLVNGSAAALLQLRQHAPLVHCITNNVVTNFTANVLLALGAAPAMVDIPGETAMFARMASGLLINLGTPVPTQAQAALEAAQAAKDAGRPWVLDPVAIGVLPVRTALAQDMLALQPDVIRGNASEIMALAQMGTGGRGVDATAGVDQAMPAAIALAQRTGGVVAVSGPQDLITDGTHHVRIDNGSPLLTRVTGGGCALGSVMAAFASLPGSLLTNTVAAATIYTIAAETAAAKAAGPGSFAVHFLDALANLSAEDVLAKARILGAPESAPLTTSD